MTSSPSLLAKRWMEVLGTLVRDSKGPLTWCVVFILVSSLRVLSHMVGRSCLLSCGSFAPGWGGSSGVTLAWPYHQKPVPSILPSSLPLSPFISACIRTQLQVHPSLSRLIVYVLHDNDRDIDLRFAMQLVSQRLDPRRIRIKVLIGISVIIDILYIYILYIFVRILLRIQTQLINMHVVIGLVKQEKEKE